MGPSVAKGPGSVNRNCPPLLGPRRSPQAWHEREQYLVLNRKAIAILKALPRISEFVFCWPDGRPLTVDYATHVLHDAAVAAGIKDLRQQDCRYDFAIKRLRGGANIIEISALLRHQSRRSTDRYLHVYREDLHRAVEACRSDRGSAPSARTYPAAPNPVPRTPHSARERKDGFGLRAAVSHPTPTE